jgi:O-antigen/teichoic acid export membrane protein
VNTFLINNYTKHKLTIHNFIWRAIQIFGKQGVTFLIFILCAKLLTPHDFGIYNYILAVIFFLIMFGDFGISTATSKFVAEYNVTDKAKLRLVLFNSLVLILFLGFLISVLTVLVGEYFLREKYIFVLYALPLIFLAPISSLYDGIYRGLRRFKELSVISLLVGLVSIFFVYFLINSYGLIGALISQVLSYFLLVLVLSISYGNLHFEIDKNLIKKFLGYSGIIGVASLSYFFYTRADILVLEYFGYIEEIGYYEIINRGFNLMFLPFMLVAQVIAPNITEHFSHKNYSLIATKFLSFIKLIIPIAFLIAILFYFITPLLINIALSEYYVPEMLLSIAILSLLIPAKIWGVFITQGFVVPGGLAKITMQITLLFGILNVIFDIIFIKYFGFVGVFWVTLILQTLSSVITTFIFYKLIKLKQKINGSNT